MVEFRIHNFNDDSELKMLIENLSAAHLDEDKFRLFAHMRLAKYCEPYVPMQSGLLSRPTVTSKEVVYNQPYAHYQYEGVVYSPSYPKYENGVVVGWTSPPEKHPTNRHLNYRSDFHPYATDHWDKVMFRERGKDFCDEIAQYILDNAGK